MQEKLTVENHNLVRGVHVQTLSEREGDWVVIESRIRRRVVCRDGCVGKSRNELLDVSDALDAGDRRTEG